METTRAWRTAVVALAISTSACATTSRGEGLSLLRRAVDEGTARVLVENLSPADAAAVDPKLVCSEAPAAQGLWFDAIRLLNMREALRAYARCAEGVNVELIEATILPLTTERRARIERYVADWKRMPVQGDVVDEVFVSPAERETADWYTTDVLMALEADGSSEALVLCERLAAKLGDHCRADVFVGRRVFDTPEDAIANDPFLTLYKARVIAKSRDGLRRFYLLETLKRPHDDTCRPIAVLKSESGRWSLERVECETGSDLAKRSSSHGTSGSIEPCITAGSSRACAASSSRPTTIAVSRPVSRRPRGQK